jgi:hypothetical protein
VLSRQQRRATLHSANRRKRGVFRMERAGIEAALGGAAARRRAATLCLGVDIDAVTQFSNNHCRFELGRVG